MSIPTLKEMTQSKKVKIGHYVGEFVTQYWAYTSFCQM